MNAFPWNRLSLWLWLGCALTANTAVADSRPNILWIIVDDMSANFSCYGETVIKTPNVDRLAQKARCFGERLSPRRSARRAGRP